MITISQTPKPVGFNGYKQELAIDLRGLQADPKPAGAPNGSTFLEIDKGRVSCYDAAGNLWHFWNGAPPEPGVWPADDDKLYSGLISED